MRLRWRSCLFNRQHSSLMTGMGPHETWWTGVPRVPNTLWFHLRLFYFKSYLPPLHNFVFYRAFYRAIVDIITALENDSLRLSKGVEKNKFISGKTQFLRENITSFKVCQFNSLNVSLCCCWICDNKLKRRCKNILYKYLDHMLMICYWYLTV